MEALVTNDVNNYLLLLVVLFFIFPRTLFACLRLVWCGELKEELCLQFINQHLLNVENEELKLLLISKTDPIQKLQTYDKVQKVKEKERKSPNS
jgi:hypothetical protein